MARIIFPEDFISQALLLKTVKDKNDSYAIPTDSPIYAFLQQHGIDLSDDETAREQASVFEKLRIESSKKAENRTEKRNMKFNPVFERMRGYFQFLKKLYKPNVMEIGEWGAPVTTTGRINYPPGFVERALIFILLKEKYDTFDPAGSSPLDPYLTLHGQSISADFALHEEATVFNTQSKQLARDAEDATEDRNNVWSPSVEHLRAIGGFLMALYNDNPKQLGEWGYTIDDSPRAPKEVVSKVKLSDQKTVTNVVIGSTFKNLGTVSLTIYKGKTATGTATVVPAGEMLGITKGMSTITVVNTSSTTTGVFSTLRSI